MKLDRGRALRADPDIAPTAPARMVPRPAAPAPPGPPGRERRRAPRPAARGQPRFVLSKLTGRVLAVNILALLILVAGLLYMGRYEDRLILAELEALRTEAQILAGSLAEGAVVGDLSMPAGLEPVLAGQMVRRLYETTDSRTRLFDVDGGIVADSRLTGGAGNLVEILPLPPPSGDGWVRAMFDEVYAWATGVAPARRRWPPYEETIPQRARDYAPVVTALSGDPATQIWTDPNGGLVLGVAVPVQRLRAVLGAVLVTRGSESIERAMQSVREDILQVFAVALGITILLSLYLAGTITRPIRRLALAVRQVHGGHGRKREIPDLTKREDEIGELSAALRDMTSALWARMDAIERFAADVAHEIKNPLTSLRSAVETTARVKDPAQQRKLMGIIIEDVQRLDRLISDISDASRLDSELSRAESEAVDIGRMLQALRDLYDTTLPEGGPHLVLRVEGPDPLVVQGIESRLVQVFRNLLTNAISFSPPGGEIAIDAGRSGRMVEVAIADQGPGIPPLKLEAIFDRFYSERPAGEKFGTHSGLGLSISKQIVDAHRGRIAAANRTDGQGARFTVWLPLTEPETRPAVAERRRWP